MRSTGSPYRVECVCERKKNGGYYEWTEKMGSMRQKIDAVSSAAKLIFGESITARSTDVMMVEALMKSNCYNLLVSTQI